MADPPPSSGYRIRVRRLGVDTYQEPVVYMHADCPVCRSEGFGPQARIEVRHGERWVIATLDVVTSDLVRPAEAGLSEAAWRRLGVGEGDEVALAHPRPVDSLSLVRRKVYGEELPSRIGDAMSQRTLEFNTVAGTADYDLKAQADTQGFLLWGVREPLVLLNNDPIWYVTDPEQFWLVHQHGSTSQQQPTSALLDAFTLTLFPIPSEVWPVKLWVSGGRGAFPALGHCRKNRGGRSDEAVARLEARHGRLGRG